MKKTTQIVLCLILLSSGMSALACSPNLPNYQNCINQQRQSMEMQQFQGRMQLEQSLGQQQRQPYRQPYDPYAFEKATIQARQDLAGQSDIAVAFSPSTGAVGVSAVSWAQLQPNVHANPMLASTKEFALASCIDKALNLKLLYPQGNGQNPPKIRQKKRLQNREGRGTAGRKPDCRDSRQAGRRYVHILLARTRRQQHPVFPTTARI